MCERKSALEVMVKLVWIEPSTRENHRNGGAAGRIKRGPTLPNHPGRLPRKVAHNPRKMVVVPVGERAGWDQATTSGRVREPFRSTLRYPSCLTLV